MCHERYSVVQHTVELADRFADAGFVAVAPYFYADTAHRARGAAARCT